MNPSSTPPQRPANGLATDQPGGETRPAPAPGEDAEGPARSFAALSYTVRQRGKPDRVMVDRKGWRLVGEGPETPFPPVGVRRG